MPQNDPQAKQAPEPKDGPKDEPKPTEPEKMSKAEMAKVIEEQNEKIAKLTETQAADECPKCTELHEGKPQPKLKDRKKLHECARCRTVLLKKGKGRR